MPFVAALQTDIDANGFAIRENILSTTHVSGLLKAIATVDEPSSLQRRGTVYAVPNLLDASPAIRESAA
jgi:hypothetical protein